MILVTGGTGLVGAHLLVYLLEKGESVRAIYRNPDKIQKAKSLFLFYKKENLFDAIDWVEADILDIPSLENAFNGVKYVYHCAAFISFDPKDENRIRKVNIEGTANIVNLCLAFSVSKLCYISSIAALGDLAPHESIITETTEWNPEKPHSDYAISKYGSEMEVWRGQQEGLDVLIVNPGVIIGPVLNHREWEQGSGALFARVKKGLPFYTMGVTGFIVVTDVVEIAYELMKSAIRNERFTLVGQNIVFKDLVFTIADALKVKRPRYHAKPYLMNVLWKLDWLASILLGRKRELSKSSAQSAYSINVFSNQKIINAIAIKFKDVHQYINKTNL